MNKGELAFKHALGLGRVPNAVPETDPILDGPARPVEVGWHPVGGLAGKWFNEQTGLGKMITDKINKYPDPTQHWAVLVGDYAHQLWMVSLRKHTYCCLSMKHFANAEMIRMRTLMSFIPTKRLSAKSGGPLKLAKRASTMMQQGELVCSSHAIFFIWQCILKFAARLASYKKASAG